MPPFSAVAIARTTPCALADGKSELPADSRLLSAMDHGLPPCTGVALGFDRIVMLAAGVKTYRRGVGVSDRSGVEVGLSCQSAMADRFSSCFPPEMTRSERELGEANIRQSGVNLMGVLDWPRLPICVAVNTLNFFIFIGHDVNPS